MTDATPIPRPPVPIAMPPLASLPIADDTTRQLAALGDAMRLLAESQKSLIDVLMKSAVTTTAAPVPARIGAAPDITGDPGAGGARPASLVDFSKLSPLQQITVGLRDAKPQGPIALRRPRDPLSAANEGAAPVSSGAD